MSSLKYTKRISFFVNASKKKYKHIIILLESSNYAKFNCPILFCKRQIIFLSYLSKLDFHYQWFVTGHLTFQLDLYKTKLFISLFKKNETYQKVNTNNTFYFPYWRLEIYVIQLKKENTFYDSYRERYPKNILLRSSSTLLCLIISLWNDWTSSFKAALVCLSCSKDSKI